MRSLIALVLLSHAAHADCPCEGGTPAPTVEITGTVRTHARALAIGATITATRNGDVETAVTDETGRFVLRLEPGVHDVVAYFFGAKALLGPVIVEGDRTLDPIVMPTPAVTTIKIESQPDLALYFTDHAWLCSLSELRHRLVVDRDQPVVSRDRTHRAWIAPSAGADPNRSVTTVDGGRRFHGAPGIPVAFLAEATTHTLRVPIDVEAGAGGGSEVALRGGGIAKVAVARRLVLGLDRDTTTTGLEMFAGGPIKQTKAYLGVGLVADPVHGGATAMTKLGYTPTFDHALGLTVIASERNTWITSSWNTLADDSQLAIHATATAERLDHAQITIARAVPADLGTISDRVGGRVGLRWEGAEPHTLVMMAEGGAGRRGDDVHADATWAAGDEWRIKDLTIHAGVRGHHRQFADHRARVLAPRASISYDYTKQGRSDLFVAYQRVSRLDDGLPGDWVAEPVRFHDELAIGAAHLLRHSALSVGLATRTRWVGESPAETGVDAWARWDCVRTLIHAAATTLGRTVALHALRLVVDRERHQVRTGATLRADPTRSEGGAALVWRRLIRHEDNPPFAFDLSLEGYAGTAGPGARVLVGATW